MTTPQYLDGSKDVTRRLGWEFLKPGDIVMAIEKGQGLRKGETVKRLGPIEIVSVRRECLCHIAGDEMTREGFPNMRAYEFVDMFARANNCKWETFITRIEFRKLPWPESDK